MILKTIPKIEEVVSKVKNKTLTIEQAHTILNWIKTVIEDKWNIILDTLPKEYIHEYVITKGGTKVYRLSSSYITLKINVPKVFNCEEALYLTTGFLISDVTLTHLGVFVDSSEVELLMSIILTIANYLNVNTLKCKFAFRNLAITKTCPSLSIRLSIDYNEAFDKLIIDYFQIKHLTNEISDEKLKDLLNKTLKLWNSNEGRKLRKEARIVYYCHKGFLNRLSVITWYFGDGVCPHDKSLDIGIAMSIHDYVLNYINNYLSKLYNVHRVFSGSGLSQIKYIVCPAKKYVIEDIISYAKRIPKILYPRKLRKLINVHSHVNPCISMKKNTEIELYGIRLTLKKREVGRGYVLCRSSTSIDRLIEIKKVLEENGVNSSIHKSGSNNYELYIPVEETKRILKQIGLEYLIESNKLPKIQEITSILSKYKFKWNVRIEAGVNGSGYRYQSECVEFELENSGVASMLAEELNHIGISTRRKKGSRKVLICRGEHRELIKKALVKAIP